MESVKKVIRSSTPSFGELSALRLAGRPSDFATDLAPSLLHIYIHTHTIRYDEQRVKTLV